MEGIEQISFQIISTVGTARSLFIEAIQKAKDKKFEEAESLIKQGELCFIDGHKEHQELLTLQANGNCIDLDLLLIHAEDQMMSAECFQIMAKEIIEMYKRFY